MKHKRRIYYYIFRCIGTLLSVNYKINLYYIVNFVKDVSGLLIPKIIITQTEDISLSWSFFLEFYG